MKRKQLESMSRAELYRKLRELGESVQHKARAKNRIGGEISRLNANIQQVKAELDQRDGVEPSVADHAIVRYLERKGIIDRAEVEREILCEGVLNAMRNGNRSYTAPDGYAYKIDPNNFLVCTVLAPGMEGIECD